MKKTANLKEPLIISGCRIYGSAERLFMALLVTVLFIGSLLFPEDSSAIPAFARKYSMSCQTCHAAFPRLNAFGEQFIRNNYRLENWKASTIDSGDEMLALPDSVPLAVRAQAFVQARQAESVDVLSGEAVSASSDFQAPYLIKLLSSAPLSENISYYFYAIFAEKGGNGSVIVEDAWFSHNDIFGSGISMMLGQFQVSDLMFPRETRMTFQDFMVYRMAGLTYDRGATFSYTTGTVDITVGLVNGNGIEENYKVNSPGYQRPDHLFDDNNAKAIFSRIGGEIGGINIGLFAYSGTQKNAEGDAGTVAGARDTDKIAYGLDLSANPGGNIYWFAQLLQNNWNGFINENQSYGWYGGFAGVDYIASDRWVYSLLYNYANGNDLRNTDTVYEGIDINSFTLATAYYFMRNIKGTLELNIDMLETVDKSGSYWTGHLTGENYFLLGFDAAF